MAIGSRFSSVVVSVLWKIKYQWKWLVLHFSREKKYGIRNIKEIVTILLPLNQMRKKFRDLLQSFCGINNTIFVKSFPFKHALHIAFRSPGTHKMDSESHLSCLQSPPHYKLQLRALFIFGVWWRFRKGSKERIVINCTTLLSVKVFGFLEIAGLTRTCSRVSNLQAEALAFTDSIVTGIIPAKMHLRSAILRMF